MNLDQDVTTFLTQLASFGRPPLESLSAVAARAITNAGRAMVAADPEELAEVRPLTAAGPDGPVALRYYRPTSAHAALPSLIYLHGGGWVIGDLESHDSVCRALANRAQHVVIAVDYRLAPEHRFPAGLEDSYAALCWVHEHARDLGCDPSRISVGGDSAGGNFAAVICLRARDEDGPSIASQLLIYPATDFEMSSASQMTYAEGFLLTAAIQRWFHHHYLGDHKDLRDWRVSPAHAANFASLPPAICITAEFDPLRDEGEAYARKLIEANVPVMLWRVPGQVHGFLHMGKMMRASGAVINAAARALRSITGA